MTPDQIRALVDEAVARAIDAKNVEISEAIGFALRTYADRPAGEKGSQSLQYGVVDEVFEDDGYAIVTLDGQTSGVPINMLGGLTVDERVAVLLVPPSGNLAIGMVTPTVQPGGTLTAVHASYVDGTGVNIGNGGKLAWVLDTGFLLGVAPNADLLDLSDPERPTAVSDGYLTFDVNVTCGDTADEPDQRLQILLSRGGDVLGFNQKGFPIVSSGSGISNTTDFSFSYPCLAGDEIFVQLQTTSGSSHLYSLWASVKQLTVS